jgi:hypothetical protein
LDPLDDVAASVVAIDPGSLRVPTYSLQRGKGIYRDGTPFDGFSNQPSPTVIVIAHGKE